MDLGKEFPDILSTWNDESYTAVENTSIRNGLTTVDLINYSTPSPQSTVPASRVGKSLDSTTMCLEGFSKFLISELCPTSFSENNVISTGLKSLDANLGGGIYPGQVTEVFGASGTGKSQFLLWLAGQIKTSTESKQESSIFISTEAIMESRRLSDFTLSDEHALENISCIYCQDIENLDHILFTQLKAKLEKEEACGRKVKMIFIDSIGHHLRSEDAFINSSAYLRNYLSQQEDQLFSTPGFRQLKIQFDESCNAYLKSDLSFKNRTSKKHYLLYLYKYLSSLAKKYSVAVLISNQVSDVFSPESSDGPSTTRYDPLEFENQVGVFSGWNLASLISETKEDQEHEIHFSKKRKIHTFKDEIGEVKPIDKDSAHINGLEKKTPALGYTWSKLAMKRILLWKFYEPEFEDERSMSRELDSKEIRLSNFDRQPSRWKLRRFAKVISSNTRGLEFSNSVEFEIGKSEIRECIT